MTAWSNNLNGIASGTTVTSSNSGGVSGTAFSAGVVTAPSGGSLTAQAAAAFEGATGLQIVYPAATASGAVGWSGLGLSVGTRFSVSVWHQFSTLPSVNERIFGFGSAFLTIAPSGQYQINNSATLATATAVTPGTWVFLQLAVTTAASTSTGRIETVATNADGTRLLSYDSGATTNAGTTAPTVVQFGRPVGVASANTHWYDLLAADNTLTSGFPGSPAPAPAYATGQFFPFL